MCELSGVRIAPKEIHGIAGCTFWGERFYLTIGSALTGKGELTMPNREKILKGLECCLGSNDCDIEPEENCPYKGQCLCAMALHYDILTLLKEQKPVKPIITPWMTDDDDEPIVLKKECGKCGWQFFTEKPKYCEECGTPIDWTTS